MFVLYLKPREHDGRPMGMVELTEKESVLVKEEWVMVMVYELEVKVEYVLQIFCDLVNVVF